MKQMLVRALLVIGLCAVGCGGGDDGGDGGGPLNPGPGGGTSFKATIDGVDWAASKGTVQVTGGGDPLSGMISLSGGNITTGIGVSLALSFISGPGTFPLGVNIGTTAGGTSTVTDAPGIWTTPLNGAAGTIIITVRSATRIAGTFEFTAPPITGGGPAIEVTDGEFDITQSTGLPDLPTGAPSVMTATLGAVEWNAATVLGIEGGASFGGSTTDYSINFTPKALPLSTGVAYDIGSQMGVLIAHIGTTDGWATIVEDSVGYVTFVTINAERVSGFFAGTVPPLGAATPLEVTSGFFSIHLLN